MTRRSAQQVSSREPSAVGTLVYLMAGLIVWGVQFTAVYGGHVLLCLGSAVLPVVFVLAATLLAVAALAAFLLWQDRAAALLGVGNGDWRASCDRIARIIAVLSVVAVIWSGLTVFFLESCALAR